MAVSRLVNNWAYLTVQLLPSSQGRTIGMPGLEANHRASICLPDSPYYDVSFAGSMGLNLSTMELNGEYTMPPAAVHFTPLMAGMTVLSECLSHLRRRVAGLPMHSTFLKGLSAAGKKLLPLCFAAQHFKAQLYQVAGLSAMFNSCRNMLMLA